MLTEPAEVISCGLGVAGGKRVPPWDPTLNAKLHRTLIRALAELNVKSSWARGRELAAGPWARAPPGGGAALKRLGEVPRAPPVGPRRPCAPRLSSR